MRFINRIRSAWQRHGAAGLPRLLAHNLAYYGSELRAGRLFHRNLEGPSRFDQRYGTDTEEIHEVGALDLASGNARHALRYQPSPDDLTRELIRGLPIDPRRFSFVDFGSGKGRVLMIAAESPFREVVGIELSRRLHETAVNNLARLPEAVRVAGRVVSLQGDVTTQPLPDGPLVCWFYNPFNGVVMDAVRRRLELSLDAVPRDLWVVYLQPDCRAVFDQSGRWVAADEGPMHVTYRAVLPGTEQAAASLANPAP